MFENTYGFNNGSLSDYTVPNMFIPNQNCDTTDILNNSYFNRNINGSLIDLGSLINPSLIRNSCYYMNKVYGIFYVFGRLTTGIDIDKANIEFKKAIQLWFYDRKLCESIYGHIGCWKTENVTNMDETFAIQKVLLIDVKIYYPTKYPIDKILTKEEKQEILQLINNNIIMFNENISYWVIY